MTTNKNLQFSDKKKTLNIEPVCSSAIPLKMASPSSGAAL
jgi:hypothetical protein